MSVSSITSSTVRKIEHEDHEEDEGQDSENKEKVWSDDSCKDFKFCFQNGNIIEGEDTMKNLRTTFAGLFGDLK